MINIISLSMTYIQFRNLILAIQIVLGCGLGPPMGQACVSVSPASVVT